MIFTGVTGGEIVSLLYPLFILNAFCYIIISKESLDGPAFDDSGREFVSAPSKDGSEAGRGRAHLRAGGDQLWNFNRKLRFRHAGGGDDSLSVAGGLPWADL